MEVRESSLISRIKNHIQKAREIVEEKKLSDYYAATSLAMECFQAVNNLIDLGELIVTEKNLGFPEKYRETFEFLFKAGIINKESLETFKRLIFLRNLIAHEYYHIKEGELREMVSLLRPAEELIKNSNCLKIFSQDLLSTRPRKIFRTEMRPQ
ncbi:MAG TPA: HepT-like ribonuclease domain-containing protein [Candidatus Nanoarchaeia archaeon]|nr:HepT-like ribonuclease domain-containing protein [Candidatus Nanoarchaeia archaeon]